MLMHYAQAHLHSMRVLYLSIYLSMYVYACFNYIYSRAQTYMRGHEGHDGLTITLRARAGADSSTDGGAYSGAAHACDERDGISATCAL